MNIIHAVNEHSAIADHESRASHTADTEYGCFTWWFVVEHVIRLSEASGRDYRHNSL